MGTKLERGGGKALVAEAIKKYNFIAASLSNDSHFKMFFFRLKQTF